MRYYPVGLDILNRRCLVVGGGEVGQRKAERLLECGARVTVVGKKLTPVLKRLVRAGRVSHVAEDYGEAQLDGAFLVIGATDDRAVNDRIFRDARRRGILANIVDDPERCDFILPALCRQGDLVITVATGGRSPALAKKLRRELEERYGPEYGVLLKIMGELRGRILERGEGPDENRKIFEALVDSDILERIRRGHRRKVEETVKQLAGVTIDLRSIAGSGSGEKGKGAGRKRPARGEKATSKDTESTKKVRPARP